VTISPTLRRIGPALLIGILFAIVIAACVPGGATTGSGAVSPTPTPHASPLTPAIPGVDPVSTIAWLFTPIFQVMFIILVAFYDVFSAIGLPAAIGFAIIMLTLIVRTLVIPLVRKQLVSQRRMQMLQPEVKEIQKRFKGDAVKARLAQQELFKERGINPLSGCFPLLLQMPLLLIMYSVISQGLTNVDPTAMLKVFGVQVVPLTCVNLNAAGVPDPTLGACINTIIPLPGGATINVGAPSTLFSIAGFGISILAIISALLQLVQSRMMLPQVTGEDDPNTKIQRQTMLFLPLISIAYGGFLPAGLFIYWITATIFGIVQQYLIVGWGGMFPIFNWTPAFAVDHTPRFPVAMPPPPEPSKRAAILTDADKKTTAEKTIRPRERGRQGRRGRRR
jgi:YidC/Oxa1 family membrane protein insertase